MEQRSKFYRILNKDGVATQFHIMGSEIIPIANFDVAYRWYKERVLTTPSKLEVSELMKNPMIMDKYEKFLDEELKIITSYRARNKMVPKLRVSN